MPVSIIRGSLKWLLAISFVLLASPSFAAVVTFSGLVNFQNYSEAGMNMASDDVWNWPGTQMAHMDGGSATFTLASAGNFNLDSVEMLVSGGSGPGRFTAFLDGVQVGTVDVGGSSGVFNFGTQFDNIDEFRVTVPAGHFTFDNVTFTPTSADVPEPATLTMFGLGAVGLAFGALRRRRKAA